MEPASQDDARRDPATARNGDAMMNGNSAAKPAPPEVPDQEPRVASTPVPRAPAPLFPDEDRGSHADGDRDSSVVSPTITSPPYWMTQGPSREPPSNISADDLPGFITLQDNERDDGPGGSNVYGRDRNRACWARSVQVRDHVLVNGSPTNIGAFVVWNIRVETLNGSYMNICRRYSEFDDLRHRLVQTFPGFEAAVPVLPPKSVISKFRPKFLEKRRAGLQYFLK
ncbi:Phox homologous domain-containing protein [Podospora conica]|nr:Phox homologous domain-containing protein [Schizothecium conicum]